MTTPIYYAPPVSGGFSAPVAAEGSEVSFATPQYYGTSAAPLTGNLTQDLSTGEVGVSQKIYHNDTVEPTWPAEWVLIGDAAYIPNVLNIIYAEYVSPTRVEYWTAQVV